MKLHTKTIHYPANVWHTVNNEEDIPPVATKRREIADNQLLATQPTGDGKGVVIVRVNLSQTGEEVMRNGGLPGTVDGLPVVFRVVVPLDAVK